MTLLERAEQVRDETIKRANTAVRVGSLLVDMVIKFSDYELSLGVPVANGYILSSTTAGVRSWIPTPSSMVYPAAGIALSTGSAWGTSIANNSANWNTAFGWGNHAGLYDSIGSASSAISAHTTTFNHTNYNTAFSWGNHAGLYLPIATVLAQTKAVVTNEFFTAYNATTGAFTSARPTWTNIDSKPTVFTPDNHTLIGTHHTVSGLTTGHFLKATGATTFGFAAHGLTKTDVGLGSVENTALSTWVGSTNITTIGTLSTGSVPWARLTNVPSTFAPSSHALSAHTAITLAALNGLISDATLDTNTASRPASDVYSWAKAASKPSYTASEVGAAPVDHAVNAATYGYASTTNAGHIRVGTGLGITTGTLSVSYGTAAGTACVGNDGRLSDARDWNASTVSQAEAEAGTATTDRKWTAQRVAQAIAALGGGGGGGLSIGREITDATGNFVVGDVDTIVRANRATAQTFSIPHSTYSVGDSIYIIQLGLGQVTIAVADGAKQTINNAKKSWGQDSVIQIMCFSDTLNAEVFKVIGGVE